MTLIALSGASGTLGRLVTSQIHTLSSQAPVLLSRTPEALDPDAGLRRYADFDRPESLVLALKGVDRLILISTDALDGRRQGQHRAAIAAALDAGVRHIVYTSMYRADCSPLAAMTADHAATEAMLAQSGVSHTVLRNAFYDDLALAMLDRADADGRFAHAVGDAGVAYVSRAQCAEAAALAGCDGFVGRRVLDITGSEALTMAQLAALASAQRGRRYEAVAVSPEALVARLMASGMDAAQAGLMAWIDAGLAQGAMAPASRDGERFLGRAATVLSI